MLQVSDYKINAIKVIYKNKVYKNKV